MTKIFLSYSSRGKIDDWVKNFAKDLESRYREVYHGSIEIWFYSKSQANAATDNFRKNIADVTNSCLIFMPILDYHYLQSGETIKELADYKNKVNTEIPLNYIKVIAHNDPDANLAITNSLIRTYLCDGDNELLKRERPEYAKAINEIVSAIYLEKMKYDVAQSLRYLQAQNKQLTIYTALGGSKLQNTARDTVVKQLMGTLRHEEFMANKNYQPLPDQLLLPGAVEDMTYDSLVDMIHDEKDCAIDLIKAMISSSDLIIVPVEFDDVDVVRVYTESLQKQLKLILAEARKRPELQVYFLLNVPPTMYDTPIFSDAFDSIALNAMKNLTIIRKQDITSFIELVTSDIRKFAAPPTSTTNNKNVYVLETYLSSFAAENKLDENERRNRKEFRRAIIKNQYSIIPFLSTGSLSDAVNQHTTNLQASNKVIIYKGVNEDPSWWLVQQSEIFKALNVLKKDSVARAIYIDPDEKERDRESYEFYSYQVLVQNPDELIQFLK